jgi:hypothetical protein
LINSRVVEQLGAFQEGESSTELVEANISFMLNGVSFLTQDQWKFWVQHMFWEFTDTLQRYS